MTDRTISLGILLSGRGSNFRAIHEAVETGRLAGAEIAVVISNRPSAPGILFAEEQGLETAVIQPKSFPHREACDQAILDMLKDHRVDLLVLAGYNRILTPVLLKAFPERILNIHPSLLPAYGGKGMVGLKVHEAVVAAGEKASGCTVHLVTEDVDAGPILGRCEVPVDSEDTPESLAEKVLAQEHRLYPQVIGKIVRQMLAGEAIGNTEAIMLS